MSRHHSLGRGIVLEHLDRPQNMTCQQARLSSMHSLCKIPGTSDRSRCLCSSEKKASTGLPAPRLKSDHAGNLPLKLKALGLLRCLSARISCSSRSQAVLAPGQKPLLSFCSLSFTRQLHLTDSQLQMLQCSCPNGYHVASLALGKPSAQDILAAGRCRQWPSLVHSL